MKVKRYIFQVLAAALFALNISCIESLKPGWEYQVDNPLSKEIVIKIDSKEYTIPADSTLTIKIPEGKHTLAYNGSSVNFVTKINSMKSATIINPTLSNYILEAQFYIKEGYESYSVDDMYESNSHEYKSDIGIVKLPVKVLNTLFIEKNHHEWTFGLDEEAKSTVGLNTPYKSQTLYKLHREDEYKRDFAEELPPGIVFPVNSKKLAEQPAYKFPIEDLLCDCEVANKHMREIAEEWDNVITNSLDIFQYQAEFNQKLHFGGLGREMTQACGSDSDEGYDNGFETAMEKLSDALKYISDASSFIVK